MTAMHTERRVYTADHAFFNKSKQISPVCEEYEHEDISREAVWGTVPVHSTRFDANKQIQARRYQIITE
jgi:carbamate kinase